MLAKSADRPWASLQRLKDAVSETGEGAEEARAEAVDLGKSLGEGLANAAGTASKAAKKAAKDGLALLQRAVEGQISPTEKLRREHEALKAAMASYGNTLSPEDVELVNAALQRQSDILTGGMGTGVRMGMEDYAKSMNTMSEDIASFTMDTLDGMGDVLTDFFLTGKAGFKDFANAAIEELMRIMVKQWIIKPIAGFLGDILPFHTGGIVGGHGEAKMAARSVASLPKFHTGGVTSGEQPALLRRGEAVMPTTRLSDGTLGIRATGGTGMSITNHVSVTVEGGGAAGGSSAQQEDFGKAISKQITQALEVEMSKFTQREMRPGGALYRG